MVDSSSISNSSSGRKPVSFFFFKLALFFVLLFSLDFSIGKWLQYFYFHQSSGSLYRTTYSIERTNQELLIFGSSRANHHYIPDVFSKNLGMSYYCVGEDGQDLLFNLSVLRAVLRRYVPKIIILDLNLSDFDKNRASYDRLSVLLPYYHSHPEIRNIIDLRGKFEKMKMLSQIYPFNSDLLTMIAGNLEMNKNRRGDDRGYIPLISKLTEPLKDQRIEGQALDNRKIQAYDDFLAGSLKAGSKVLVVVSPYYWKLYGAEKVLEITDQIARKYNVKVLNYSQDSYFLEHPEYFSDDKHLNQWGAKIFSEKVAQEIGNIK